MSNTYVMFLTQQATTSSVQVIQMLTEATLSIIQSILEISILIWYIAKRRHLKRVITLTLTPPYCAMTICMYMINGKPC